MRLALRFTPAPVEAAEPATELAVLPEPEPQDGPAPDPTPQVVSLDAFRKRSPNQS